MWGRAMVKRTNPSALVAQFAEDVAQQTDAIWRGDHKTGNKHAKGSGLIAFEASQAMRRWEEKTWGLDPA